MFEDGTQAMQQQMCDDMGEGIPAVPLRQFGLLRFSLLGRDAPARSAVEALIRARFLQRHDARIVHFLPELLSLDGPHGCCAAVGLCQADEHRLFAEAYLPAPVEQVIAAAAGHAVLRADVVEIGNLVSGWRGGSLLLFVFLGELLDRLGPRYAVFTATREVERLLARLGYAPGELAAADPARLADGGASWGRYYAQAPRVLYGEIRPAVALARRSRAYRAVARLLAPQVERACDAYRTRHAAAGAVCA